MKENLLLSMGADEVAILGVTIVVIFFVATAIRKLLKPSRTYTLWSSIVGSIIFTGIYVYRVYRDGFEVLTTLLYLALVSFLVIQAFKSRSRLQGS
jgi:hypothetical protein